MPTVNPIVVWATVILAVCGPGIILILAIIHRPFLKPRGRKATTRSGCRCMRCEAFRRGL
jgi:hypothetical protein